MWAANGVVPAEPARDVALMDERTVSAIAAVPAPHIDTINVTQSSKVHVGTKVVSITQNVHNKEMLKELPLPLYLWNIIKNSSRTERLSCAAALTALSVCIALIVYFSVQTSKTSTTGDKPPHEWNITRAMWLAKPHTNSPIADALRPVMLVVVQHTVSQQCTVFSQCAAEVRKMQGNFLQDKKYDIPYNFIIGNDGRVYEGRGWNIEGAHTYGYNRCSVGLGFIGDYREEIPNLARVTELQLNRTRMMLDAGVTFGYLRPDYQIVGARDLQDTVSPGSNLYNALKQFDNYDHQKRFAGLNCEQIQEKYGSVEL
ncbi:peptidoglycan recognition protein 1 isoform X1 [Bicyclus anynana]|uniref:Peptidoglycan recognition protein n=1 Tax=Bicyclus anynana TaxID=110368 RepID=A0A6J1NDJ9_BICAN|nr:peptidoglycan recognition protein 1 isoform X1 [Bicyclus anynana]